MTIHLDSGTYGVIGRNAAGKTTLLEQLHRRALPGSALARSSHHALFAGRTVGDHLAAAALPRDRFDADLAQRLLPDVTASMPIHRLSTGQARRLTLAATLGATTETVLLDEPFDGLDTSFRDLVRGEIIAQLDKRIHTLVLTSHRSEDLAGLVDSVITVTDNDVAGPVLLDEARSHFPTLTGPASQVDAAVGTNTVLRRDELGGHVRVVMRGTVDPALQPEFLDDATLIDLLAVHGAEF